MYLTPTLVSLTHPLHRKIELLKGCRFQISLDRLRHAQEQLRAVVMLWKQFRRQAPDGMKSALSDWLAVSRISFQKFVSTPEPLSLSPRALQLPMHRFDLDDLLRCVQAAISRSFARTILGPFGPHAPFLCLEPVYEEMSKSRVKAAVGNRMHYHVKDLLSAMWVMAFADVTRGLAQVDCANGCGTTFTPGRVSQRFCCTQCANAYRARKSYQKKKLAGLTSKSKRTPVPAQ
jgi:hypothetical protein